MGISAASASPYPAVNVGSFDWIASSLTDIHKAVPGLDNQHASNQLVERVKRSEPLTVPTAATDNLFGGLFDVMLSRPYDREKDIEGDFCARKYVVDLNLLDPKTYDIEMNPRNFDPTKVDCKKIVAQQTEKIKDEMKNRFGSHMTCNQVHCAVEKFEDENYINKIVLTVVLSQVKLTDEQKQTERKKFIKMMNKVTHAMAKCYYSN